MKRKNRAHFHHFINISKQFKLNTTNLKAIENMKNDLSLISKNIHIIRMSHCFIYKDLRKLRGKSIRTFKNMKR